MGAIVGWLFKTALGRSIGGAIAATLLSGLLYAGCQVRRCMRVKEELREYHRADKIRKEDPKVDQRTEEHKKQVEEFFTPDDLKRVLTSCGTTGPTTKVEKPPRPRISQSYENLLLQAPPALQKEAQKHEWDWHGYADKMEMRAGYK